MPFKVAFRTSRVSVFRQYLTELIGAGLPGARQNELVLCSGYWRPAILAIGPTTLVSQMISAFDRIILLSDRVTNLTAPPPGTWYRQFVDTIRHARSRATPIVESRISSNPDEHFWHGKIALRICDDKVIAALIGSSNMTNPAYDVSRRPSVAGPWVDYFNLETDVLLWRESRDLNAHFTSGYVIDVDAEQPARGDHKGGDRSPEARSPESSAQDGSGPLEIFGSELNQAIRKRGIMLPTPANTDVQLDKLFSFIMSNSDPTGWPT